MLQLLEEHDTQQETTGMTRIGSPESFRRRRPAIKTADEVRSARRVGK